MRVSICVALVSLVACGDQSSESGAKQPEPQSSSQPVQSAVTASHLEVDVALLAVKQAGCAACHSLGTALDEPLAARQGVPLARLGARVDLDDASARLVAHYGGADADDIRIWMRSLAGDLSPLEVHNITSDDIAVGGKLVAELACGACHTPSELNLSTQADFAQVASFLRDPKSHSQDFAHVSLRRTEVDQVAAWLLRDQRQEGGRSSGFKYQCFELPIEDGDWPGLSGIEPSAVGVVSKIDNSKATRKANYAMQFTSTLDVPREGEWTFATRSDDGSWLWIDGALIVDNSGLKPATRNQGQVFLTKGQHELRVGFTQGGGGAALKVMWSGPGQPEQELPASVATVSALQLVPPVRGDSLTSIDAVDRGRLAARARRCDACHAVTEVEFMALQAPNDLPPYEFFQSRGEANGATACPQPAATEVMAEVGALPERLSVAQQLHLSMQADGCTSCHERNGKGGLPMAVRKQLREVEDIGDEGILPPNLSDVGRRLRGAWLERVIRDGHKARDYVVMRMPAYGEKKAAQYRKWFNEVDAKDVVDEEPAFSAAAVEHGRKLAGTGGRNCISCHTMSDHASLGPQGMDLAKQYERLRPGWFRDWLLKPTKLRENTRMPSLWLTGSEQDRVDVNAMRVWLSLGEIAPLPSGFLSDPDSLILEPLDRPILHGAFLQDVSARTLAVGTPMRTHYAFDLVKPRLVWIWRGAFLDARGTWFGRAGQLVKPLGKDWQVIDDFAIEGDAEPKLLGQLRTDDGYPVLRVACGNARYQDEIRARLKASGSDLIRTIRCEEGELLMKFPSTEAYTAIVDGKPASEHTLNAGQTMEIVYQW